MSTAQVCTDCRSFSPYSPNGFGEDSRSLLNIYTETLRHLKKSYTLGKSLELLDDIEEVAEECSVEGWDGYSGTPINEGSILMTRDFVEHLPVTSSIPMPEIVPEPNGDLSLEWHVDQRHVFTASIKENGQIIYAGLFGENKVHGTEYFAASIPSTIIENLKRLYR